MLILIKIKLHLLQDKSGTLNLRSSNNLPEGIPKFSQLSLSLPNYDLFLFQMVQ